MPAPVNLIIGSRYGSLTVLERGRQDRFKARYWRAKCDCGKIIEVRSYNLMCGKQVSCGCKKLKHGNRRRSGQSVEYGIWTNIITRCENPNNNCFSMYGGRGISICQRWRESFSNFLEDMGKRPTGFTIDRIDNSKGYFPENCRWATPKQQARNTRRNRILECRGEKKNLAEWADISPVHGSTIHRRLGLGWNEEEAIFLPKTPTGHRKPTPASQVNGRA